jgi:hypothetical protein
MKLMVVPCATFGKDCPERMSQSSQRKPYLWPMIFLTAFVLGALLWGLWMAKVIRQTRQNRDHGFFVPLSSPSPGQAPRPATNSPSAWTNSALTLPESSSLGMAR